ncbi:MAG: hypothetical protein QNK23_07755 [Crocinitomicaceae bacterium]|nr:hypothetical protein [Crocinitomicaceae bacterium]
MSFLKKYYTSEKAIVNAALLIYLISLLFILPFTASDSLLFFTVDSKEYYSTLMEFFQFDQTGYSETRPILYPLILWLLHSVGGATLVTFIQLFLWLISANLIYFSVKNFTQNRVVAVLALVLFSLNISLIALTFHALTEVVTVFFLSLLIFQLVKRKGVLFEIKTYKIVVSLFVVLTLIKPLFFIPLLAFLFIGTFFYFKKFSAQPKKIIGVIIILLPLLFQMTVMKTKYDEFTVSRISELTVRRYFVAQRFERVENIPREEAIILAEELTKDEVISSLLSDQPHYWQYFHENVNENISGIPVFLSLSETLKHPASLDLMQNYNDWYKSVYGIFKYLFLGFVFVLLLKKKILDNAVIIFVFLLSFYIIWTTGISFSQGDRLTLPSIPLSIFGYLVLIHIVVKQCGILLKTKKNK